MYFEFCFQVFNEDFVFQCSQKLMCITLQSAYDIIITLKVQSQRFTKNLKLPK